LPKVIFPGGALVGCDAGFLNTSRIKGSHTAIKSGMLAAQAAFAALQENRSQDELQRYPSLVKKVGYILNFLKHVILSHGWQKVFISALSWWVSSKN
jgi:flavin-dependent dehydrogenase